jgi:hypothetical protein
MAPVNNALENFEGFDFDLTKITDFKQAFDMTSFKDRLWKIRWYFTEEGLKRI